MINRSTGKTLFEVLYTQPPKHTLDLIPLPRLPGLNTAVENMAEKIQQVHSNVRFNLEKSNLRYKQAADKHRIAKIFQKGDLVMVHPRKQRFPMGTYNRLKHKKFGPCRVVKKINDNAYVVELSDGMLISHTFNVVDIFEYHTPDEALYPNISSRSSFLPSGEEFDSTGVTPGMKGPLEDSSTNQG